MKIGDVAPHFHHFSDKLMPHDHWDRDSLLSPCIPFVDVEISAADTSLVHLDENVVDTHNGFRHIYQPESPLRFLLG